MTWHYFKKTAGIWWFQFLSTLNSFFFRTYESNSKCVRCRDCGRTVHDWFTSDDIFEEVTGSHAGVWCWDCFCERAWKKGIRLRAIVKRDSTSMGDLHYG